MNIRQKYLLATTLFLLVTWAAVLPARRGGEASAASVGSAQSQIPQRQPLSPVQVAAIELFRDLIVRGVDWHDAAKISVTAIRAGDEHLITNVQKRFDRGRLDAAGVLAAFESVAADRIRPEGDSVGCAIFGNGVELGCRSAGGDPSVCAGVGDYYYCDCMGAVWIGGGMCL
jgi:hypothetical protein